LFSLLKRGDKIPRLCHVRYLVASEIEIAAV
jgi:hypothetical protein